MNLSFLIQYGVPTFFLAIVVAILGAIDIPLSFKFTLYGICLVATFAFKAFIDKQFKKSETQQAEKEKNNQIKKITQLEGRIEDLEYDIYMLKLEHTQELHQIERNLNRHLATNTKCVENSKLWTGMERTLSQIAKMSDTALEKSKESTRANKRVNRK